jgi:hypothetical protein
MITKKFCLRGTVYSFLLLLLSFSCTEDLLKPNSQTSDPAAMDESTSPRTAIIIDPLLGSTETPTVLGIQLPNPYLLTNMKQAYKNITGSNAGIVVNALYVRFQPTTVAQLTTLHETLDLDLTDTPMDYQITQQGDYYQDPSIPDEQISYQYAVVAPTFSFPSGIAYTILASVHIPTDLRVEAEAERLAGLNADGDGLADNVARTATVVVTPNLITCAAGYHWDTSIGKCVADNCDIGMHYDTSLGKCVADVTQNPGLPPAGTINAWDTQLQMNSGVRNLRVVAKRWFKVERMMTDNLGRFTATKKFRNKVKVLVKFKNDDSIIRNVRGVRIWKILLPLEYVFGTFSGSSINKMAHTFVYYSGLHTKGNLVWNAAMVHNAVQEFKTYASQLSIGGLPGKLKIFLSGAGGAAAGNSSTPMFAKRAVYDINIPFNKEYGLNYSAAVDATISQYLAGEVDLALDYFSEDSNGNNSMLSDHIVSITYHELSHAAHYNKVGNTTYTQFVNAEITEIANYSICCNSTTDPYGPGTDAVSPIIALGEGWAYHMGHYMADIKYGVNGSCESEENQLNCPNSTKTAHPHIDVLETFDPGLLTYSFHWIPKGLMLDLMDNTPNETYGTGLPDQVSGYTNQQIFNALQSDVKSVGDFKARLLQQNNNSQQVQVDNLVQFYGY